MRSELLDRGERTNQLTRVLLGNHKARRLSSTLPRQFCARDSAIIFQEMPNRSTTIPYRDAKNVSERGI